jgi:hypothetical protein
MALEKEDKGFCRGFLLIGAAHLECRVALESKLSHYRSQGVQGDLSESGFRSINPQVNLFFANPMKKSLPISNYPESDPFKIQDKTPVIQTIRPIQG